MPVESQSIDAVAELLSDADSVLVITGAGVSADSGLPTYRGIGGLYDREATAEGYAIEEALSGWMMRNDPALCWKYIHEIEQACRGARPNDAHRFIAELESRKQRCWVLTQNVDGLHREAGSSQLMEIHGNIQGLMCTHCDWTTRVDDYAELEIPPKCTACGGLVRPDVVLFGEMLPTQVTTRLYTELTTGFDLVLSVGTSSGFPYIAEPVMLARRAGKPAVEINPGASQVTHIATHHIKAGAAEAFTALARRCGW